MTKKTITPSLTETINWVSKVHDQQYRKGTDIPYISHVYGVASLLMRYENSKASVIKAALLHDTVEDTDITLEDLKEKFGEAVASYVGLLSEDKSKSWEERKQFAINHLKKLPKEVKWIKLADKINSLEMMQSEIIYSGIDWDKFNRGYLHQKWFYGRIFYELKKDENIYKSELFNYGIELLKEVFDTELGSKATYRKITENPISINSETMNETFKFLIKKWKVLAKNTSLRNITWYVKQAKIIFKYQGTAYALYPSHIDASSEIFESIRRDITDDLISFGGEDVLYSGILD
jgi:hypothetical protein